MSWSLSGEPAKQAYDGLSLVFELHGKCSELKALQSLYRCLSENGIAWLKPLGRITGDWLWDFDGMRESETFREVLLSVEWLHGRLPTKPEYDYKEDDAFFEMDWSQTTLRFHATPEEAGMTMAAADLHELLPSCNRFRVDHPAASVCAFVMMRYDDTPLHKRVVATIRQTCRGAGVTALLARDKAYADDLLLNIRAYMHCCSFGIAVFDRLTADDFNPNVSLEIGYMMALGKPVCLLRDRTLKMLQTDLVGRLYESFDVQAPEESIPSALRKWMQEKLSMLPQSQGS